MSKVTGNAVDFPVLSRVFEFVKPYKKTFAITLFLTIALAFLSPLRPWLIQYTFDHHIANGDAQSLLYITLLMVALLFAEAILNFYYIYLANWLGQVVIRDMRVKLYAHINQFRLKYFDHTPIGTLVTRVISDMETIADIFSEGLLVIIGDVLKLIVVIGVMFWVDYRLALISLSTIPVLLFSTWLFKNGIKSSFQEVRNEVAKLNAFLQEHITGMNVVQIFNREDEELDRFKKINARHRDANIRSIWYYSVFLPVVEVLSAVSIGLLVWWGSKGVIRDQVTLGNLVAFILYIHMLFRPIRELADRFNTLQMGMVSSERVFKVMDTVSVIDNNGSAKMTELKGEIKFENVWFAYNEEDWVLKGISFTVKPGETMALVGATGSGKSSIISLLSRFYEYNKGKITIDGIDIRDYELNDLRKNIAVVLQDVFLFSDTIANNISMKNEAVTKEQIREAAIAVGADAFISSLPRNYDYNVMERGAMLSVGQRQLISFIRAYIYNPKILVLDEATSSIDTESEFLIQAAMNKLTENRTSIVIAHRLATVQKADKIIVLDKGEILEMGTHQQLLKNNTGITKPCLSCSLRITRKAV
jgi:ATP-binding cassette subfamily B multidrug efflux pump